MVVSVQLWPGFKARQVIVGVSATLPTVAFGEFVPFLSSLLPSDDAELLAGRT